jgi:hypothetical protein
MLMHAGLAQPLAQPVFSMRITCDYPAAHHVPCWLAVLIRACLCTVPADAGKLVAAAHPVRTDRVRLSCYVVSEHVVVAVSYARC